MLIFIGPKYSSAGASTIFGLCTTVFATTACVGVATGFFGATDGLPTATAQEAPARTKRNPKTRLTCTVLLANSVVGKSIFVIERKIPVASIQIAAHDLREVEARMPHLVERITWAASQGAKL